tara:strand:+ start:222 stop:446 length:225 start_codon:yes stop_codon:yes gene_type:complete
MEFNTLDLHGFKHSEVKLEVENYLYLNQEDCPILIICGNSQKMISLVEDVLEKIKSSFETGSGVNYGTIIVRTV